MNFNYIVSRYDPAQDIQITICGCHSAGMATQLARMLANTLWRGCEIRVYDECTRIHTFLVSY